MLNGVYNPPDSFRQLEDKPKSLYQVIASHFSLKLSGSSCAFFEVDGLVNLFDVFNELFPVFARRLFYRIAHLLHDTALKAGIENYRLIVAAQTQGLGVAGYVGVFGQDIVQQPDMFDSTFAH